MPFNFDIDAHINPYIPRPRLYLLPASVSRFLGYRAPGENTKCSDATVWFWGFVGAFLGIALIEGVFMNIGGPLEELGVPMVIGSFGATAILLFHTLDSPLSQPRNVLFGQLLSAITGICITKLFLLSSHFDDIVWLVGAISCATALVVMAATKTTHPPAGATALIAAVDANCRRLGWWYLTCVLLSASLILVVAILVDNIKRKYPVYWWTPVPLGPKLEEVVVKKEDVEASSDLELKKEKTKTGSDEISFTLGALDEDLTVANKVVVTASALRIPRWLREELGEESLEILEMIQSRLAEVERGEGTADLKRLRSQGRAESSTSR